MRGRLFHKTAPRGIVFIDNDYHKKLKEGWVQNPELIEKDEPEPAPAPDAESKIVIVEEKAPTRKPGRPPKKD